MLRLVRGDAAGASMKIFQKKERGVAVVEFALVVPLLLLILFGIIEFGILFYDKAVITNASREAARQWIVYRDVKLTKAQIDAIVDNYTNNRMISMSGSAPPQTFTDPVDPTSFSSGDALSLTVRYSYDFVFLPGFMDSVVPTIALDATTVMRAE